MERAACLKKKHPHLIVVFDRSRRVNGVLKSSSTNVVIDQEQLLADQGEGAEKSEKDDAVSRTSTTGENVEDM